MALQQTERAATMLMGNGDGTFQQQSLTFVAGVSPVFVAAGDFNGDGKLDLVVADSTLNTANVLFSSTPAIPKP